MTIDGLGAPMWEVHLMDTRCCDCPLSPRHRWNCTLTPIWAQTMRELDVNPWTVDVNESRKCTCAMTESSMWSCPLHGENCEES